MNTLKKWIPCILSLLSGVLGLSLLGTTGIILNITIFKKSTTRTIKAQDVFKNLTSNASESLSKGLNLLKIISIICIVIYILMLLYSVILFFYNLNLTRFKKKIQNFSYILFLILIIFIITLYVLCTIAAKNYALAYEEASKVLFAKAIGQIGFYPKFMLILATITNLLNLVQLIKIKNKS